MEEQREKIVSGYRITMEEVLEPAPLSGRHDAVVTMRVCRMMDSADLGWVGFCLNNDNKVEQRNGSGAPIPAAIYAAMGQWAGEILRDIARSVKEGRRPKHV